MTSFRYGGGKLSLKKSAGLIGVKMRAGTTLPTTRSLNGPTQVGKLGGFQILQAPTTRGLDATGDGSERTLDTLRKDVNVLVGTHVFQPEGSDIAMVPTGELYVVFRPWATNEEQLEVLETLSLQIVQRRAPGAYVVRLGTESPNPIACTIKLQEHPLVAIAEPDLAMEAEFMMTLPDDPFFKYQWHLKNTGTDFRDSPQGVFAESKKGADAKVVEAWEELGNTGSSAIVMAIIDNGFDLNHPDFDGAGRVVHGWDYVSNSPDLSREPTDTHGTLCAGVALAGSNGQGIVGVAPNSRFMPIRNKELSDIMIELVFERVMNSGADVISCSWGRPGRSIDGQSLIDVPLSTRQRKAVVKAAREGRGGKGCVVLFAAGNNNRPLSDFCRLAEVIAVGASTSMDERADYSNFGPNLSILGPSGGRTPVISTFVTDDGTSTGSVSAVQLHQGGEDLSFAGIPEGYKGFAGTSCSCPVVAGVCALILSANPDLSSAEVKEIIEQTADKIGDGYDENGHSDLLGFGRVNSLEAVREARNRRRTPARPIISAPITVTHEMKDKLYNSEDYRIYHLNLNTGLEITVEPEEGSDGEFELSINRGSRPTSIDDHGGRVDSNERADQINVKKLRRDDYYVMVRAVKGSGDFVLKIALK